MQFSNNWKHRWEGSFLRWAVVKSPFENDIGKYVENEIVLKSKLSSEPWFGLVELHFQMYKTDASHYVSRDS